MWNQIWIPIPVLLSADYETLYKIPLSASVALRVKWGRLYVAGSLCTINTVSTSLLGPY